MDVLALAEVRNKLGKLSLSGWLWTDETCTAVSYP